MKKITPWKMVFFVLFVFISYKAMRHEYDDFIAKQIYSQMEKIDNKLDQLQTVAFTLKAEKESNIEVIHKFNELNKDNFAGLIPDFERKVQLLNYESSIQSQLLKIAESATKENYRQNRYEMKMLIKQVKVDYNQKIINFTDEISQLTLEVTDLNNSISSIHSERLRELEIARLKFLSDKISQTVTDLKGSFLEEVFDNVMSNDAIKEDDESK